MMLRLDFEWCVSGVILLPHMVASGEGERVYLQRHSNVQVSISSKRGKVNVKEVYLGCRVGYSLLESRHESQLQSKSSLSGYG